MPLCLVDPPAGGGRIPGLTYDQKLAEADKLYSSSAAAYMADPRLQQHLRLPQPVDNKNGKAEGGEVEGEVGRAVVKTEEVVGHATDYVLSHGYALQPPSSPSLAYTLPEPAAHQPSILYMYPGPDSPKVHYAASSEHPHLHPTSGVSPPTLRLASPVNVLSLAQHSGLAERQGDPASSSPAPLALAPSSVHTTCCTFSLTDFGAVAPLAGHQESHHSLTSPLPLPVSEVRRTRGT